MTIQSVELITTARSNNRAVLFWFLLVVDASVLAFIENNNIALWVTSLFIPLYPGLLGVKLRGLLVALSLSCLAAGPESLVFVTPIALAVAGHMTRALAACMVFVGCFLLAPYIDTLPDLTWHVLPLQSFTYLALPPLIAILLVGRDTGWLLLVIVFTLIGLSYAALDASFLNGLLSVDILTDPLARVCIVLMPVLFIGLVERLHFKESRPRLLKPVLAFALGFAVATLIPLRNIDSVVFDEGHGPWETVEASFGPDDFGRNVNYTYSLLFKYAEKLVGKAEILKSTSHSLPSIDDLLVLKVPTQEYHSDFIKTVAGWVKMGGRLIVIADHTDLFDTTQHLNQVLAPFNAKIASDAVFDSTGMPNRTSTSLIASVLGRIDALGTIMPWQTGASISRLPLGAITLASFGSSFKEPADYSRLNRFGTFQPRPSLAYTVPSAVVAFPSGLGSVTIILDSTPWSNFSLFRVPYKDLFRRILHVQEHVSALWLLGLGAVVTFILGATYAVTHRSSVLLLGAAALGVTLGAGSLIGVSEKHRSTEGIDYKLLVGLGSHAHMEFLPQLVPIGSHNYSRIISSTEKYGRAPRASHLTAGPDLSGGHDWLLIEPDGDLLPTRAEVLSHLRRGGNLTVMFSPASSQDTLSMRWLDELGLLTRRYSGLAVSEDFTPTQDGILGRRSPTLIRAMRLVTTAKSTSLLKDFVVDDLFQTFELRPTGYPRTSGLLTIGFSAYQFSDYAISDVWEGVDTSSIGRLREHQLEAALTGEERLAFPTYLRPADRTKDVVVGLSSYVVVRNGSAISQGTLPQQLNTPTGIYPKPYEDINDYLLDLRSRAMQFVAESCPKTGHVTRCDNHFLGPDLTEWIVVWSTDSKNKPETLELAHERRFSGTGSSWNVVFGK